MFTKFHYDLRNWTNTLRKNIERCTHLINTYPDDPRTQYTMQQLNVYQVFYNLMTGHEDISLRQEDYDFMVKCYQESKTLGQVNHAQDVQNNSSDDVVVDQVNVSSAPELEGDRDIYAMIDQLHFEDMEQLVQVESKPKKKKTKKV